MPALNHRVRADRLAFLLQVDRDLARFSPDEEMDRLVRHVHRGLGPALSADLGFVWRLGRGGAIEAEYRWVWTPKGTKISADAPIAKLREQAAAFVAKRTTTAEPNILFTLILVDGRPAAVIAFLRPGRRFGRQDALFANQAAEILGHHLEERDRDRAREIRERIVGKVLLQLRPADILYQVLHGLKRLLRYDHSAGVQTFDPDGLALVVRAETIAWTKGKSPRIGHLIHQDAWATEWIAKLECCAVVDPTEPAPGVPETMIRDLATISAQAPVPRSMIVAPLRRDHEIVGILTVRDSSRGAFTAADLETIDSFLPILSASAFHAEVFRHQQDRLFEAERRTALGNIARAISHDLSNAFGVIQPLIEKLHSEVDEGTVTPQNLVQDMDTLNQYINISLRIFEGLLAFSRGTSDGLMEVDIATSVDTVLSLLSRGLRGQGIEVVREIPADLPRITARRQDIEQILLNLITNARESMASAGRLTVRAWVEKGAEPARSREARSARSDASRLAGDRGGAQPTSNLRIAISDTGQGIPAAVLQRIFEPFFTTKSGGTGLGLDICRSIVWEYDGAIWLESVEGKGSTAHVRLPLRAAATSAPAGSDGAPSAAASPAGVSRAAAPSHPPTEAPGE